MLENEYHRGSFVSGERLAILLGNQHELRLVVLNSCEGGRTDSIDPFARVATTLVRTGSVSAVVAMQLAITDQAAITFSRGFYNAISTGRPVDSAVTQARLAIFADENDIEWGTPVLYMRSPDGLIFDIQGLSEEDSEKLRLAVRAAKLETIRLAKKELEEDKSQARLAELYEAAVNRIKSNEWLVAYDLLLEIKKIEPGFRDVGDLLDQLENEKDRLKQKTSLIDQGKEYAGKGEWPQAIVLFQQALRISVEEGVGHQQIPGAFPRLALDEFEEIGGFQLDRDVRFLAFQQKSCGL